MALLTEQHLGEINKALSLATETQAEIELAKRAGIDVSAAEASLKDSVSKLRQIKSVYFPNHP